MIVFNQLFYFSANKKLKYYICKLYMIFPRRIMQKVINFLKKNKTIYSEFLKFFKMYFLHYNLY